MGGPTPAGRALTSVTIEVFAVNGRLIRIGDKMSAAVGLTTARWQVMGLLQYGPATAAQLARERGLRRQAVQQTVSKLQAEGMVKIGPNPRDRRAPLVHLTTRGKQALEEIYPIELRWIEQLATLVPLDDMETTLRTLRALRARLDEQLGSDGLPDGTDLNID
jgi:DNA-binding MarR family transcriptional regulator